jgi:DNA recombination protein RmuC
MDKLAKQLETAQNTVSEAGRRTRAVQKSLKDVEGIELAPTDLLAIPLASAIDDEDLEELED